MHRRIFVYGGNAASTLVSRYSEDAVRAGFVARQSLISAMNRASTVRLQVPADVTPAAARLVHKDLASSLVEDLERSAAETDLVLWDLDDERFGVYEMEDGSYLTRSPQLVRSMAAVAGTRRHIEFGSREHLGLWTEAATTFFHRLKDLGLAPRTYVLRLHWAAGDATGNSVELEYGPRSFEMNALFDPYFDHLKSLGMCLIEETHTTGASADARERSPLNLRDEHYHRAQEQLLEIVGPSGAGGSTHHWNWDVRHRASLFRWTHPNQVDVRFPGRAAHHLAPRPKSGEKFPVRFLVQNNGSDTLLVISHGALPRGKYQVPRFEWLATLESRPENLLFLADGALEAHPDLELGWFTGDAEDDLTARFGAVVQRVSRQLGVKRVLFMGGSGGGFVSLALAAAFPGSRALVFNPQTAIRRYWHKSVAAYQRTLFPSMESINELEALGPRVSAVSRVRGQRPSDYQVIYVQNDDDAFHMENHLGPFAAALGMEGHSSVSSDGNVQLIVDRFADGHNMPYRQVLLPMLDLALNRWGSPMEMFPRESYADLLAGTGNKAVAP